MKFVVLSIALFFFGTSVELASAFPGNNSPKKPYDLPQTTNLWHTDSNVSDQIRSKIVVLKRTQRGKEMEVRYRIQFSNVPQGKRYKMFLLTGFMKKNGLPEADLSKQFGVASPSNNKTIGMEYGVILYKGEWIRIRLRSLDGTIEKAVRFTLYK